MALIAKHGTPRASTGAPGFEHGQAGLYAGEAIEAGDVVTVASDGTVMIRGTEDRYRGVAAGDAGAGDPITIYSGINFHYGQGLTPGTDVFATTDGALDDTSGDVEVGFVVDSTRIYFYSPSPADGE